MAKEKLLSTDSFSISPSKSALHQPLSFSMEWALPGGRRHCFIHVMRQRGRARTEGGTVCGNSEITFCPDGSLPCNILARSLALFNFNTCASVPAAAVLLLTSVPATPPTPERFAHEVLQGHLFADSSCSPTGWPTFLASRKFAQPFGKAPGISVPERCASFDVPLIEPHWRPESLLLLAD